MRVPPLRMPLYRAALRNPRVGRVAARPDNEAVLETALAHPNRFIPYVFLNPTLGQEAHDELDRALAAGARGVKLHPWLHEYRLTDALQILKRCEALRLPVLAHLGTGPAEDVARVIATCPRLKLVLAHAGIPHYERLWRLDRILFDVALPQLTSPRLVRRLVEAVGPSRVVYGSDAPTGIRAADGHAYSPPSLPDRAMGENLLALLE
jgi:predicted TIM-barrel fold metal-dependent hydrolase